MSDDLVRRLAFPYPKDEDVDEVTLPLWVLELTTEAADRIEELEAQIKTVLDRETSILRYYDAKLDAADAKLAEVKDRLFSCAMDLDIYMGLVDKLQDKLDDKGGEPMSYEKKLLTQIVDSIYSSDFSDNIVVARLNDSLDGVLEDLERLNKLNLLSEPQVTDFVDNIHYGRGLVTVLQAFTVMDYYETTLRINKYEDRFKGEF